jgi:hypothetical protein
VEEAKKIQKATKAQKSYEEAAEAVYREAQTKDEEKDDKHLGNIDLEEFEAPVKHDDKIPAAAEEALEKAKKESAEHVKDEL